MVRGRSALTLRLQSLLRPLALGGLVLMHLGSTSCFGKFGDRHLMGIPFYPEPFISNDYCLAASIQMWAGYDRISPLPGQTPIFNWLGGSAGGFSPSVAAAGVVHFTRTSNAVYDAGLRTLQSDRDQFLARQVTAVQAESPALVIYSNHAVIVDGGLWHQDPVSYNYV